MSQSSLVSIIVNNFNYSIYLRDAIDSALQQSYGNIEIVVVDDGSTDASRHIIAEYGDKVLPILKSNGGQASAFTAGFKASQGNIIIFLDADDTLEPSAAALAVQQFTTNDVVKVHWPLRVITAEGRETGKLFPSQELSEGNLLELTLELGPLAYVTSPTSGNAWSRHYLEKVMPVRDPGNKHGGDAYLSTLAPLFGEIRRVTSPQGCYRVHGENFSGLDRKRQSNPDRFRIHAELLREYVEKKGHTANTRKWILHYFAWPRRMRRLSRHLASLIPRDSRVYCAGEMSLEKNLLPGRQLLPFLHVAGEFWGYPIDDADALAHLRADPPDYFVFLETSFWWFTTYPQFCEHLTTQYKCLARNDELLLVHLSEQRALV